MKILIYRIDNVFDKQCVICEGVRSLQWEQDSPKTSCHINDKWLLTALCGNIDKLLIILFSTEKNGRHRDMDSGPRHADLSETNLLDNSEKKNLE